MRAWFFLAAFFLFPSCAHVHRQPTGLRPESFWKDQEARKAYFSAVTGKIAMAYRHKGESVSGVGRILWELKDRIRLELRDPLGRAQFLALLKTTALTVYYPSKKVVYRDENSGRSYSAHFFGFSAAFPELRDLFVGRAPEIRPNAHFTTWEWSENEAAYLGMYPTKNGQVVVTVDPDKGFLRRIKWVRGSEEVVISYFDYFLEGGSVFLAERVELSPSRSDSGIEIEWRDIDKLEKQKGEESFEISLPKGVDVVLLK